MTSQGLALALSYLVVLRNGPHASLWMLATGAVQIVFGLFALGLLVRRELKGTPASGFITLTSPLWQFALPIAFANFAVWGLMQGYRPLVENFAGLGALSIVGLGLGLASSIAASFEALVQQVFLPVFYRRSHSKDLKTREKNWNSLWQASLPSYLGLTIVLIGLSQHFVSVLTNGGYPQASLYLAIGVSAEFLKNGRKPRCACTPRANGI